jgi:prepilin-type N-terminal cleavage/methylation domain-containing protein/prepilin-type processing-associated H-X9-DG protein
MYKAVWSEYERLYVWSVAVMKKKNVMCNYYNYRGFTLVELLVVIAIIGLLMGLLLPGLAAARRQAKFVKDKANIRQWGVMLTMFAQDNNNKLMVGWNGGQMWMTALMKYYKGSDDIVLCPMASTVFRSNFPPSYYFQSNSVDQTFMAWGKFGVNNYPVHPEWGGSVGMYGSYGINGWAHDPLDNGVYPITVANRSKYWRTIDVKSAAKVPLFGDCMYDGSEPDNGDSANITKGAELNNSDTSIWCIDRHNGGINMSFMDGSIRKVGLRELWKLQWHRTYNTRITPTDWSAWLRTYPAFNVAAE